MSSWADEADETADFGAPPPVKSGWGKVEPVQPVGLTFEDFEVRSIPSQHHVTPVHCLCMLPLILSRHPCTSGWGRLEGVDDSDRGRGGCVRAVSLGRIVPV